jgi:hypothetical protein
MTQCYNYEPKKFNCMESGENGQTDTEPGIGYHINPHMYWGRSLIMIYIHFIETQLLQAVQFCTDVDTHANNPK